MGGRDVAVTKDRPVVGGVTVSLRRPCPKPEPVNMLHYIKGELGCRQTERGL